MHRIRPAHVLALVLVIAGAPALAQKLPADIPVVTSIADVGGEAPLSVQSDRKGAYVRKVVNKVTQVQSALVSTPSGYDWFLTTYYSSKGNLVASDRKVFFDLREQLSAGAFSTPALGLDAAGAQVPYGLATAHLAVKCATQAGISLIAMSEGYSTQCPGSFRFRALDGNWYRLAFNPDNVTFVDKVKVSCQSADASGCKMWTFEPSGQTIGADGNPRNRTTLLQIDSAGTVLAVGGDYLVSFSITVAR